MGVRRVWGREKGKVVIIFPAVAHLVGYLLIVVIVMELVSVMLFVFAGTLELLLIGSVQPLDTMVEQHRHCPEVAILGDVRRQRREFVAALQAPKAEANMKGFQVLVGNLIHEKDPFHDYFFDYSMTIC
jgi:hypothetical protein